MKVRVQGSTIVHSDIPPAIVHLLMDCGIRLNIIREEPAPAPEVMWGVRETGGVKFITRTYLGTTTNHTTPPPDCPPTIAAQLNRPSDEAQAAANAVALERAQNAQANYDASVREAKRW